MISSCGTSCAVHNCTSSLYLEMPLPSSNPLALCNGSNTQHPNKRGHGEGWAACCLLLAAYAIGNNVCAGDGGKMDPVVAGSTLDT